MPRRLNVDTFRLYAVLLVSQAIIWVGFFNAWDGATRFVQYPIVSGCLLVIAGALAVVTVGMLWVSDRPAEREADGTLRLYARRCDAIEDIWKVLTGIFWCGSFAAAPVLNLRPPLGISHLSSFSFAGLFFLVPVVLIASYSVRDWFHRLLDLRPRLVADANGLTVLTTPMRPPQTLPWTDIRGAGLRPGGGSMKAYVKLAEHCGTFSRAPTGQNSLLLLLPGVDVDHSELAALIDARAQAASEAQPAKPAEPQRSATIEDSEPLKICASGKGAAWSVAVMSMTFVFGVLLLSSELLFLLGMSPLFLMLGYWIWKELQRLVRKDPILIVDASGLTMTGRRPNSISWQDILGATSWYDSDDEHQYGLVIHLKNFDRTAGIMRWKDERVDLSWGDYGMSDLAALINERVQRSECDSTTVSADVEASPGARVKPNSSS